MLRDWAMPITVLAPNVYGIALLRAHTLLLNLGLAIACYQLWTARPPSGLREGAHWHGSEWPP